MQERRGKLDMNIVGKVGFVGKIQEFIFRCVKFVLLIYKQMNM